MVQAVSQRPEAAECGPFFGKYVQLVPDGDVVAFLDSQLTELLGVLRNVSEPESLVHHAPYTWSLRQVVGHMTDCERVFGFRALWIARGDASPLAGFDETAFMAASAFDAVPLPALVAEFEHLRRSHILLFRHLPRDAWTRRGTVNAHPATARVFAWVMGGHAQHHLAIVRKRLRA
jgi:hypothetical protein